MPAAVNIPQNMGQEHARVADAKGMPCSRKRGAGRSWMESDGDVVDDLLLQRREVPKYGGSVHPVGGG